MKSENTDESKVMDRREEGGDKRVGRQSHGDGSACCHQSLKDKLKHCEGRQGEQRKMVPSFPGVRF